MIIENAMDGGCMIRRSACAGFWTQSKASLCLDVSLWTSTQSFALNPK
ncbi:hypothetical protein BGP_5932 [Beggiatoa sp. PS]|nr:hypothetical protein BGP_5932 [Beggiatoa sp. PS]